MNRSRKILIFDTLLPIYLGVLVFIITKFWFDIPWPKQDNDLLSASLTVSSVVVGFLISAKAIILTANGKGMEIMRKMNLLVELVDAFAVAIYLSMSFSLLSCLGFFGVGGRWYEALWSGLGLAMMFAFSQISRLLFRIVRMS
jgi:hypothetical protein